MSEAWPEPPAVSFDHERMTTTETVTRGPAGGAADFVAARSGVDSIARARRHTRRVKALRLVLPLAAVALVVTYGVAMMGTAGVGTSIPVVALQKILPTDLKMDNPHYDGYAKDGSSYVVDAKWAKQNLAQPNAILLDTIVSTLIQPDKSKTVVTAATGTYDHKTSILELSKSIDVKSESGLKATLTQATINTKDGTVVSKEPVVVEFPSGSVRSKTMTLNQKTKDVTFDEDVVALLKPAPPKPGTDAAAPAPEPQKSAAAQGLFQPSTEPIDIRAAKLAIADAKKLAVFSGGVTATQTGATMTSPTLEVTYQNQEAGDGQKAAADAGGALTGGKVQRIVATGPVVMTQPDGQKVESDAADFDAEKGTAALVGNVVMSGASDQRASADRIDLDQQADTALLTGSVVVQQGVNVLKGRRFTVDRKQGRAQLTAPPGSGAGPGRVTAHFIQDKTAGKAKAETPKTDGGAPGFATFKTDPNAPIDIEAEQLDIDDHKQTATFRGDVQAVQGTFSIRTPELAATYSGDAKLTDVAAVAKPEAGAPKKQAQLTKLDARKSVVVTSKDGQMARGDWATFDQKSNTVVVGGDVSLSQGGNLVRGKRLTIDMVSGESRIETEPSPLDGQSAKGGWVATAPDAAAAAARERPSAVLFPKSMRDAQAASKKNSATDTAKGGAVDGWSAKSETASPEPQN